MNRSIVLLLLFLVPFGMFAGTRDDIITIENFEDATNSYAEHSFVSTTSGVTICGQLMKSYNVISLRYNKNTPSGIVTKNEAYQSVTNIIIKWNSNTTYSASNPRKVEVYGKTRAYSSQSDLYQSSSSTKGTLIGTAIYDGIDDEVDVIPVTDNYGYFGFLASSNGTSYIESITIQYQSNDLDAPTFSAAGGMYDEPLAVAISAEPDCYILYKSKGLTGDYSDWTAYTEPLAINEYTELVAKAVNDELQSDESTVSYIVGKKVAYVYSYGDGKHYALKNDGSTDSQVVALSNDGTALSTAPQDIELIKYDFPSNDFSYDVCCYLKNKDEDKYLTINSGNSLVLSETAEPWYLSRSVNAFCSGTMMQYAVLYNNGSFGVGKLGSTDLGETIVFRELNDYGRSLGSTRWGTICLPNAAESLIGASAVYEIAFKDVVDGNVTSVALSPIEGSMVAGKPYIFRANDDATMIAAFYSGESSNVASNHNGLYGTLESIASFDDMGYTDLYMLSGGIIQKAGNNSRLSANRAYILMDQVPDASSVSMTAEARARCVIFGMDGSITDGISHNVKPHKKPTVYNLYGQQIVAPTKGINIINGKKIILR